MTNEEKIKKLYEAIRNEKITMTERGRTETANGLFIAQNIIDFYFSEITETIDEEEEE